MSNMFATYYQIDWLQLMSTLCWWVELKWILHMDRKFKWKYSNNGFIILNCIVYQIHLLCKLNFIHHIEYGSRLSFILFLCSVLRIFWSAHFCWLQFTACQRLYSSDSFTSQFSFVVNVVAFLVSLRPTEYFLSEIIKERMEKAESQTFDISIWLRPQNTKYIYDSESIHYIRFAY